jgi:hypothetical protein
MHTGSVDLKFQNENLDTMMLLGSYSSVGYLWSPDYPEK